VTASPRSKAKKAAPAAAAFPQCINELFTFALFRNGCKFISQLQKKRPWALPKPTMEKFPLDPLHSSPQPPTLSGAPSPVGSFQMCIWKSQEGGRSVARINSLNSFPLVSQTFTVDTSRLSFPPKKKKKKWKVTSFLR